MKDLAAFFADAGCTDIVTYVQSGNVIFKADKHAVESVAIHVTQKIRERFGYAIPVILRTSQEIMDAIAGNPFVSPAADENAHFVMFLEDLPKPQAIAKLDPNRSPTDEFRVRGSEIYLYLRTGAARSKLTNAWFDKNLETVSTARNWRTVLKLGELMSRHEIA